MSQADRPAAPASMEPYLCAMGAPTQLLHRSRRDALRWRSEQRVLCGPECARRARWRGVAGLRLRFCPCPRLCLCRSVGVHGAR